MALEETSMFNEKASLSARSRPQYHYFYGTTEENGADANADAMLEGDNETLLGEELVQTDQEEETPSRKERDIPHLIITNGDSRPPLYRVKPDVTGLVPTIALIVGVVAFLIIIFFPRASEPMPIWGVVPYSHVDRADYGDPVEGFLAMNLFHPTLLSETKPRAFKFPFPSGAFWTNLIIPSDEDDGISYPIVVYPYAYKWAESYLQLSYPAAHRYTEKQSIQDSFQPDISISAYEDVQNRFVTKFDPLSVTLRFIATPDIKWETSLVQGSPYTTIKVLNATPKFRPLSTFKSVQCPGDDNESFSDILSDNEDEAGSSRRELFGVCSIDETDKKKTTMRGVQFIFKSAEGLSWIMFSSEPMNLEFDTAKRTIIKSQAPFTGIIRLAHIPASNRNSTNSNTKLADSSTTGLRRLIYHAGVYPTGGQVSWDFHSPQSSTSTETSSTGDKLDNANRQATVRFDYTTQTMIDSSNIPNQAAKPLLMLALPHHAKLLSENIVLKAKKFDLVFQTIKGPLTPVIGASWSYNEPLTSIGFGDPVKDMDPVVHKILLEQVDDDLGMVLPTSAENIHGFGKQIARLAQLTYIAKQTHNESDAESPFHSLTGIPEKAHALLSNYLEIFLSSQVTDKLLFDSNLGGLVSNNGLEDTGSDFGNGRYNDHHFHYGYILYACAIMGKIDPLFLSRFGPNVDAIFHDVAHPFNGDSREVQPSNLFFPLARHKSWFDGHSFATGLFPFRTGKSQESSSEAANCYYGAYLWSLVRHGDPDVGSDDLTDYARLLLAMELRSAKTYWHMLPSTNSLNVSNIYTPEFQENYMVGNLGMLDVAANTWLGDDPLHVHMINALPITAMTAKLFDKEYVKHEYPYLIQSGLENIKMAWRGYAIAIHAVIDPAEAWKEAQDVESYQLASGLSKSQLLYWISQRPGFTLPGDDLESAKVPTKATSGGDFPAPMISDNDNQGPVSCSFHPACIALNITGLCCPPENGIVLDCCS